jgi:activator of 2-hydroxyglutaryl-CoA dehydratase
MLQYAGIDIGSTATKIALLDEKGGIGKLSIRPTGFSSAETAAATKDDI